MREPCLLPSRRVMPRPTFAIVALSVGFLPVAAPAAALQKPQAAPPKPAAVVDLEFGWQPGMVADVESVLRNVRGPDRETVLESTYVLEVQASGDGLRILMRDGEMTGFSMLPAVPPEMPNPLEEMFRAFSTLPMEYKVSRDGEFLGVPNPAELQRSSLRVMEQLMDDLEALVGGSDDEESQRIMGPIRQMLGGMTSEAAITSGLAEQWNSMVWLWAWESFELGRRYAYQTQEPSPLLPSVVIPYEVEMGALERAPCFESAPPDSCVRLRFVSVPEPSAAIEAVRRGMGDFFATLGEEVGPMEIETYQQVNVIEILAEPGTLRPHWMSTLKELDLSMTIGEESRDERRVDETETRFVYR